MMSWQKKSLLKAQEQDAAIHECFKDQYRASLYSTAKYLLGYSQITQKTHGPMIRALEAPTLRKLIVMPRGTFKSTIGVVAYSIWLLMNDPNHRILIDSEVYSNSKNFLREIKAHLVTPEFTSLFGEWKADAGWTEGEITVAPRTKSYKEASITCGGIGTVKVGQHFSVIIGDDLNSGNNSMTPESCEKVVTHYRLNQAILDPGGIYVLIGTRYSMADLIGHVLENEIKEKGLLI